MERGAFCFRNEGDGCIAGRYFNDGTVGATRSAAIGNPNARRAIFSEACIRTQLDNAFPQDPFCGTFTSTWIESTVIPNSQLTVSRHATADGIYTLRWGNDQAVLFHGRGMITDGLLMGYYTNERSPVEE
jgi:hypothetical protein